MSRNPYTSVIVGALILLFLGCGGCSSSSSSEAATKTDPEEPAFDPSLFDANAAQITNQYLPLGAGKSTVLEGETDEGNTERMDIFVSHVTKEILGVMCAIIVDRVYEDDELVEETFDWFAQDMDGNVW